MLLIAGGEADTQLRRMIDRARARGITLTTLLHSPEDNLPVIWDLETGTFRVGTAEIRATAAFIRQDVFRYLSTRKSTDQTDARNWKVLFDGWVWANPDIRIFNRDFAMRDSVNKPLALTWARDAGLPIPRTAIHASKDEAVAALDSAPKIKRVTVPLHLLGPLRKLTNRLGLTYAAADFKASAESDALIFLEVNSNPMFAAFDHASDGALVDGMLDWLTE